MRIFLLVYRLLRVALHLAIGMATCGLLFPRLAMDERNRRIQRWSRQLLGICAITLEHNGAAALENAVVVANHVSWLDIFVINALYPCRFVAKAEIRDWPIMGWLAGKAGTVFIARGNRRDLRHIFKGLVQHLQAGERVAFFPEGTSALQGQLLPFHANLFEAALDARVPVQALALSYLDASGKAHGAVDFVGDISFVDSMLAILGGTAITARVLCLPPMSSEGAHRRDLAAQANVAVAQALGIHPQ